MTELYEEHADLYDIAFDWDVTEEAAWLHERLGSECRTVLEPGCGSGRIVEALARRGLEVVGLDRSVKMIEAARRRLAAAGLHAEIVCGDMTSFRLARRFDGAVCPINTLLHLTPSELAHHLDATAAHLRPGARYLLQLSLYDSGEDPPGSSWEASRGDTALRIEWTTEDVDLDARCLRARSRVEILSGERAGEVVEELHAMTAWTTETWAAAVAASPFEWAALYDGGSEERPRVGQGTAGELLWHELALGSR